MGLKSNIANRVLSSKLGSVAREKKVFNLELARTAGILWEYDQLESFAPLENELRKNEIKSSGLCYFPAKKAVIPEGITGFTRKQTSWTEIPDT